MLNIKLELKENENSPIHLIDGRTAEILLVNKSEDKLIDKDNKGGGERSEHLGGDARAKSIGSIGEIHPKILRNWKIKMPVALFEIDLEEIFRKFE